MAKGDLQVSYEVQLCFLEIKWDVTTGLIVHLELA